MVDQYAIIQNLATWLRLASSKQVMSAKLSRPERPEFSKNGQIAAVQAPRRTNAWQHPRGLLLPQ